MIASSTAGLLFKGYVLFSCGKFVFYTKKEEIGFICPDCGCEAVRGKLFHKPIGHEEAREIVRDDVERIFLKRDRERMKLRE